jgi:Trk-type K+ transport system membrane component
MSKSIGIRGFLMIYVTIIAICIIGNLYGFEQSLTTPHSWIYSISLSTLTHFTVSHTSLPSSESFYIYSIIITQVSGLVLLSVLLWLCWQLFGNDHEKSFTVAKALKYTSIVTLISELALFIFFLYSIPKELTNDSFHQKLWAAVSLAVHSFNNAGFTNWTHYFQEDVLSNNFMVQVGVIAGSLLGSLGIFVIIELFSPSELRKRLDNPSVDWTFITKISLFGSAIILAGYAIIYLISSNQSGLADRNILESISLVFMDGASARGFGYPLVNGLSFETKLLYTTFSFIGAGPFSTGGGTSLLFFVFIYTLAKRKNRTSKSVKTASKIVKNWLVLTVIFVGVLLLMAIVIEDEIKVSEMLLVYNSNYISSLSVGKTNISTLLTIFLNIGGRISFIIACLITLNQIKHASRSL